MTSVVVLSAYLIKLTILTRNGVKKILLKKLFWTKFGFINSLKTRIDIRVLPPVRKVYGSLVANCHLRLGIALFKLFLG